MCGRFALTTPQQELARYFAIHSDPMDPMPLFRPRYNIAPTQDVATIRISRERGWRELAAMHWGLIPSWSEDPTSGNRMINARSETIATKPSFRVALKCRRCIIPASGFYEWKKQGKTKQPYYIERVDKAPLAFAGLWEHWKSTARSNDREIESCTIITTEANVMMRELHDRMPVILAPGDFDVWLDPSIQDVQSIQHLLTCLPDDALTAYAVSMHVNNPKHDDAACLEGQRELF